MKSSQHVQGVLPSFCKYLRIAAVAAFSCSQVIAEESAVEAPAGGRQPEIVVEQPSGMRINDGKVKRSLGTAEVGKSGRTITFRLRNLGSSKLTGLRIGMAGVHVSDFSLGVLKTASLKPGATTIFKVTFTPKAKGERTASLRIFSNDKNENPFNVTLTGQGVK